MDLPFVLDVLVCCHNKLSALALSVSGSIPAEIGCLTNLLILDLGKLLSFLDFLLS